MKILCVAEKPSMARQICELLAPNGFETRNGKNKYCKNFQFTYMLDGQHHDVVMTSVLGHVLSMDFGPHCQNWANYPIENLFNEEIIVSVSQDMKEVAENLRQQARWAQRLVIWTDCDREGEFIGYEVEKICLEANGRLDVFRARYSVVNYREINNAMGRPDRLDRKQVDAVASRQEIDLRTGACLTRLQTLGLRPEFAQLTSVISYGSCQFPTLGFVVEQYLRLLRFVPAPFWFIKLVVKHEGIAVPFAWDRHRVFDRFTGVMLYLSCSEQAMARITSVQSKPTSRWKPLPLRTVEFQKKASKALRLSSDKLMALAEKLYNKGYISYPRTETDQFDSKFDHRALLAMQVGNPSWGAFADRLVNLHQFGLPRLGKNNDKAHPPIHPTKAGADLSGDEARVYDFVTRSYLGACSHDARGMKTTVACAVGSERFHAQGVVITERNYLDVYPYDVWNEKTMANFQVGQTLRPEELLLESGETSPPSLLSESDLIGTMDKNGIGTDATIHEHIKKVLERKYVLKQRDARFIPTLLGLSLVQGHDEFGSEFSLTKPRIRADLERDLTEICNGLKRRDDVIRAAIDVFKRAFAQTKRHFAVLSRILGGNMARTQDPFAPAPLPNHQPARRGEPGGGGGNRPDSEDDDDDDDNFNGGGGAGGTSRGAGGSAGPAKRQKTTAPKRQPHTDASGDSEGPDCECGKPSQKKKTTKAGPNQGRYFWTCSACNFFAWADAPTVAPSRIAEPTRPHTQQPVIDSNPTVCACGKAAAVRTVSKEGPNKGRQFYSCAGPSGAQCNFFSWKDFDVIPSPTRNAGPASSDLRCSCGLIAVSDAAKSGGNAGKIFYRCSKQVKRCTFFQWADGGSTSASAGTGSGSGSRCFKCGEEGHFSNACPSNQGGGGSRGGRRPSRGRGRGRKY